MVDWQIDCVAECGFGLAYHIAVLILKHGEKLGSRL
jgi:hypothetical protein